VRVRRTVNLCCASRDEDSLEEVLEVLKAEGTRARVVRGVESDPDRLTNLLQHDSTAVVILFISENLNENQLRRLKATYVVNKQPTHHFFTAALSRGDAAGTLRRIRNWLAIAEAEDMDEDEGVGQDEAATPQATEFEESLPIDIDDGGEEGAEDERAEAAADPPSHAEPVTSLSGLKRRIDARSSGPGETGSAPIHPVPLPRDSLTSGIADFLEPGGGKPEPKGGMVASPAPTGGGGSGGRIAVALLLLAAVGGGAFFMLQSDSGSSSPAAEPAGERAPASGAEDPKPPGDDRPDEPNADEEPPADLGETGETGETGASEEPFKIAVDVPTDSGGGATAPTPTELRAAVRNGTVVEQDGLFVAREPVGGMLWKKAAQHCRGLTVDGVSGWRLPAIPEYAVISHMGVMKRHGHYWSGSLVRDEDRNLSLAKAIQYPQMRRHIVEKVTPGVHAVCVQRPD
jgi:hypothetical protein